MISKLTKSTGERRDAVKNHERILAAAAKLFDKYGVEKISMKQIANEAQVGSGTLYRHFNNKSDLSLALIKSNIKQLFDDIEGYLSASKTDQPIERLKEVLRIFIAFREKKEQILIGVEGTAQTSSLAEKLNGPIFGQLHDIFVKLLHNIFDQQSTVDPVFRADVLVMLLSHEYYSFQREIRHYSPEKILNQLYQLLVAE